MLLALEFALLIGLLVVLMVVGTFNAIDEDDGYDVAGNAPTIFAVVAFDNVVSAVATAAEEDGASDVTV